MSDPVNPLIVQSDLTVLLETATPKAADGQRELARFAELLKAPEHVHTYRISALSLWNAAAAGLTADDVCQVLHDYAKYPVAASVDDEVVEMMGRYGRLWLTRAGGDLVLASDDPLLLDEVSGHRQVRELLGRRVDDHTISVREGDRGAVKQALLACGWPPADEAGFLDGDILAAAEITARLRPYQADAVDRWWRDGGQSGGNGVVVLPCGAGKTVVGLAAMAAARANTLVVCTTVSSIRQWMHEAIDKTRLTADDLGEWSGRRKQLRPVTFVTYQSLVWSDPSSSEGDGIDARHPNLRLFDEQGWGLIIYDEVHLLPAPVFRATARIQAVRRLGLTATLIREDGREGDIFSLIGPKRYDAPWLELEAAGWIAPAVCTEVRVALGDDTRRRYADAEPRSRYKVAATAGEKLAVVDRLVERHRDDRVLVIGQYVDQLRAVAERLDAPLLTGRTSQRRRDELFDGFRSGRIRLLVVSKVANFSIDLPEASVAIQVSGQFGSRQEEAQRLGRILRPKSDGRQANFYTVVAADTDDSRFARNRQRFLAEQGYAYSIVDAADDTADDPATDHVHRSFIDDRPAGRP
ncbi:MAG: DNA repair helicase XPB [Acidimicrobiales bacterium]